MDLQFETIERRPGNDGKIYLVQRANVTRNGRFWARWKSGGSREIQKTFAIRKDIVEGRSQWFAYWIVPEDGELPLPAFSVSYQLRSDKGLLPYQPVAVQHLANAVIEHASALDGSDTGLGKTYVALAVARELQLIPHVLCRKGGIPGWKEAASLMGIRIEFIVNWERAKTKGFPYTRIHRERYTEKQFLQWNLNPRAMLIFDEAHMANNTGTINNTLYMATKDSIPTLALSATFADKPLKMMPFLDHTGAMPAQSFLGWLKKRGHMEDKYAALEGFSDVEDMKCINRLIYPAYGYRLKYTDPAVKSFFPDAIYHVEKIAISKKNTQLHNKAHAFLAEKLQELSARGGRDMQSQKMVLELRFRQYAEMLKCEALYDYAKNLLTQGASVCIFVNFRETLNYLAEKFKTRSLIYGEQEKDGISRNKVNADFQANRSRILIAMLDAGGVSINLHDLDGRFPRVSLICPTYRAIALKQVFGRTHRAKAKSIPVMKMVYTAGTIEEKVADSVRAKIRSIDALNDGDLIDEVVEQASYGSFSQAKEIG